MAKQSGVSVLGVGLGGFGLVRRHWLTALLILGLAQAGVWLFLLVVISASRATARPPVGLVLTIVVLFIVVLLTVGQWLVYRRVLSRHRGQADIQSPWPADVGRILVATLVWLAVTVVVQILASVGLNVTGLRPQSSFYNAVSYGLALVLLALTLFPLGYAAAGSFQQRRFLLFAWPATRGETWRVLLGWAVACALMDLTWWGAGSLTRWLGRFQGAAVGYEARYIWQGCLIGLAFGLTLLLLAPAWAQAWRQTQGREADDPAAVFD